MTFIIDPETNGILDSIPLPRGTNSAIAHPLQPQMLITADGVIYQYDLTTGDQAGSIPGWGTLSLLEPGRRLLLSSFDSLRTPDMTSLSTVDADTAFVWDANALPGVSLLAGTAPSPPSRPPHLSGILAFSDLESAWHDTLTIPGGFAVIQAFPHPDGRHALVLTTDGGKRLFLVDARAREASLVANLLPFTVWFNVIYGLTGDTAYVAASQDPDDPNIIGCSVGEVLVVNVPSDGDPALLTRVQFDSPAVALALSSDGSLLCCGVLSVSCFGADYGGEVAIFDARSMERTATLLGFRYPAYLEIGPEVKH